MTPEQILEKTKERGYSINISTPDRSYYALTCDRHSIALALYPNTDQFQLVYYHGLLKLSTDTCGSFSNDDHFRKFERMMIKAVRNLRDGD